MRQIFAHYLLLSLFAASVAAQTLTVTPYDINGTTVSGRYIAIGDQLCVRYEVSAPGAFVVLLAGSPGNTMIPGVGNIPLGDFIVLMTSGLGASTTYNFQGCDIPCDPSFIGITAQLAFVAWYPDTGTFEVSNAAEIEVVGPLGPAGDFNVFTTSNFSGLSDVEGRLAVGGNATLQSFGLGSQLSPDPLRLDLIVRGNLTFTNGQISAGSGIYSGSGNISNVGVPNGSLTQVNSVVLNGVIDFTAMEAFLKKKSATFPQWPVNGTTQVMFGGLFLSGSNPLQNIFVVSNTQWQQANYLQIDVPPSSSVLISVAGTSHTLSGFGMNLLNGLSRQRVLFNFHEATTLNFSSISVQGSVLAPCATVSVSNGNIEGNLIAGQVMSNGGGEAHNDLFLGCFSLVQALSGN